MFLPDALRIILNGKNFRNHFFFGDSPWRARTWPIRKPINAFAIEAFDPFQNRLGIDIAEERHFRPAHSFTHRPNPPNPQCPSLVRSAFHSDLQLIQVGVLKVRNCQCPWDS